MEPVTLVQEDAEQVIIDRLRDIFNVADIAKNPRAREIVERVAAKHGIDPQRLFNVAQEIGKSSKEALLLTGSEVEQLAYPNAGRITAEEMKKVVTPAKQLIDDAIAKYAPNRKQRREAGRQKRRTKKRKY